MTDDSEDKDTSIAVSRFLNEIAPGVYDDEGFKHGTHYLEDVEVSDIGMTKYKQFKFIYKKI